MQLATIKRKVMQESADAAGSQVAMLECFHTVPWSHEMAVGAEVSCPKCQALEMPDGLVLVRKTPEFTDSSVPQALLNDHTTKAGTWGQLHVLEGAVVYQPNGLPAVQVQAGEYANIPPAWPHSVRPEGVTRFYVAFYTRKAVGE